MAQSALAVGHGTIDAQHRAMLSHMDQLARCAAAGDVLGTAVALNDLWDETIAHFAFEEDLMLEHAFPEREAHRMAHHFFLADLQALMLSLRQVGLSEEVATWARQDVADWFTFHIGANDATLALFVVRKTAARIVASARGEVPAEPRRSDPVWRH